jgi:chromosome partitioning protein
MSMPDDLAARGRAIFERLRTEPPAGDAADPAEAPASPDGLAPDGPDDEVAEPSFAHLVEVPPLPVDPPATETDADEEPAAPDEAEPLGVEALEPGPSAIGEVAEAETPAASVVDEDSEAVPVLVDAPPLPRRPLPRIMAVANQKGGVGKTTTAVNLSAALAELGYRVLVVDLDPQGNASTGLGVNARSLESTVYDVLMRDLPLEDAIEPTSVKNLFVVPATIDLAGAEIELVPAFSRELKLKRALETVGEDFDYTLIDCPPSLGLLTVNALAAANEVVVPIQCEYYALEGLGQLLRNVQLVRGNLNPTLELSTIILTMYDARTKLAEQVASEVREHFGPVVCRHIVPRTVRLSEAPSFGQPIISFDPSSRGAIAYRELAKEVSGGAP